jgi:hypothetical protein
MHKSRDIWNYLERSHQKDLLTSEAMCHKLHPYQGLPVAWPWLRLWLLASWAPVHSLSIFTVDFENWLVASCLVPVLTKLTRVILSFVLPRATTKTLRIVKRGFLADTCSLKGLAVLPCLNRANLCNSFTEMAGCDFWVQVLRTCDFLFAFSWILSSGASQLLSHQDVKWSYGWVHMAGNWGQHQLVNHGIRPSRPIQAFRYAAFRQVRWDKIANFVIAFRKLRAVLKIALA